MNILFELIGLSVVVVGFAFFTTFFFAAVAGTMVVILAWAFLLSPATCTNDCITNVFDNMNVW